VKWELAADEAFRHIVAAGEESAEADWGHSVHAEPAGLAPQRWYWYRFTALGDRSTVGRTRTAPAADAAATLNFAIASCQRYDVGYYGAWRHVVDEDLDLVMFLGDYIYESAARPDAVRPLEGGLVRTLAEYRARYETYKSDPALQAAHAHLPWLLVWDDHEVSNDYAGLQGSMLQSGFAARRAAAYQAYWEHMPFAKSQRPAGADMRITGRLDWGRLARIHLLDDRQYRDVQACPRPLRGGSNSVALADCAALLDPKRSLLGAEQERWLAEGWDTRRPWNLLAQQTLMARFVGSDPALRGGTFWTDGWDGYAPARRRLLDTVADRKVPGVVVLGGDLHSNYVADLKRDFEAAASPTVATEFCGTSITSTSMAQSRTERLRALNPNIRYARSDAAVTSAFAWSGRARARLRCSTTLVIRRAASRRPRASPSNGVARARGRLRRGRPTGGSRTLRADRGARRGSETNSRARSRAKATRPSPSARKASPAMRPPPTSEVLLMSLGRQKLRAAAPPPRQRVVEARRDAAAPNQRRCAG
jgi:alkaline phosphatase D